MRVLITGMGGELGTRVANLLEGDPAVTDIMGIDWYPPRRRIFRTEFHRVDPRDRRKTVRLIRAFDPEAVFHLGVYEPNAKSEPTVARLKTAASAVSVLGAAAQCPSLQAIVMRSGLEVYGRGRGAPTRPDEATELAPTSPWGESLAQVEQVAVEAGEAAGVPVTRLRCAPIVGPSFPSPLGRYLRLAAVAVNPVSELPFSLLHQEDAAHAIVTAGTKRHDGALNVVGPGAVTASQAVLLGRRIPIPVMGPAWALAGALSVVQGAPLPPHTRQVLIRGGVADGSAAQKVLGIDPRPTHDVVTELYQWASVAVSSSIPRASAS